jgi:L-alanine-DL-glutamate epimerase-like enolase superfamily enzyme
MAQEAARLAREGFDAIKIKIEGKLSEDSRRIAKVREAVGPSVRLMLDANSGFDPAGALALAREAARHDVFWLEEPVFLDDLPGYRRIRRGTDMRIALGEGEFTAAGFRAFIREGLIDVVQPNITRAGGFTGVRRIAALAEAFGLPIAPHTGASGPVCMAATLQLGAGLSGFLIHEHMFLENPFEAFFTTPLPKPVNGVIEVPQGPGLGVEPDPSALEKFARRPFPKIA